MSVIPSHPGVIPGLFLRFNVRKAVPGALECLLLSLMSERCYSRLSVLFSRFVNNVRLIGDYAGFRTVITVNNGNKAGITVRIVGF